MTGPLSSPPSTGRLLAAAVVSVLASLVAFAVVGVAGPEGAALSRGVTTVARVLAATLFLTAGGLRLARWWMTSEARSAYMGAALVVLGGATLPLWHLANALDERDATSLVPVLTRTVGTACCVGLVALALNRGDDDSLSLQPRVLLARGAGATAGACALLVTAGVLSPGLLQAGPAPHLALDASMACAWAGIATVAFLRGSSQRWAGRAAPCSPRWPSSSCCGSSARRRAVAGWSPLPCCPRPSPP